MRKAKCSDVVRRLGWIKIMIRIVIRICGVIRMMIRTCD